jgi:hypothetical protein
MLTYIRTIEFTTFFLSEKVANIIMGFEAEI